MIGIYKTCKRVARVESECLNCGKIFKHRITENRKFCSNKCVGKYHTGEKHHSYNLDKRVRKCEYCGKEFEVNCISLSTKYCCRECMGKAQRGENHWMWKGDELLFICDNCGVEYRDDSIKQKQNAHHFCSQKCNTEFMVGEKHPCWRGGLTYIDYPQEFNESLKEQIRDRDNRVCQMCLMTETENGKKLQVHHIDWNKQNSDPLNLISLCTKCHGKIHTKENTTREHFSKIAISNSEGCE